MSKIQEEIVMQSQNKSISKTTNILDSIHQNIDQQLPQGKIMISQKQKSLPISTKTPKTPINKKIKTITQRKQEMEGKLQIISKEEEDLKVSQMRQRKIQNSSNKRYKSSMSIQDTQNLKKLLQNARKFEKQLIEKTHQHQFELKQFAQQEEQLKKQKKQELQQMRKYQIEQSLQLMQKKRMEQKEQFEQEKKKLKQVMERKRVHQNMKQKWKKREELKKQQQQQIVQQIRKMKNVNFDEIKQHSKKYDETIIAIRQSRVNINNYPTGSFYNSIFRDAIISENQQKKQQQLTKVQQIWQLSEKKKDYSQQIRVKNKSRMQCSLTEKGKENDNTIKSLSFFETHKRGVEYMRKANTNASLHRKPQKTEEIKQKLKIKYKNYLSELKGTNNHRRNKSEMDEITSILNNDRLTQEQKMHKTKMMTEKLQSKPITNNLVKSINAKLQLLRHFEY